MNELKVTGEKKKSLGNQGDRPKKKKAFINYTQLQACQFKTEGLHEL